MPISYKWCKRIIWKLKYLHYKRWFACIIGQSIVSFSTWLVYIYLHLKSELTSYNFSFYCFSFYRNVRSCIHLSPDECFLSTMFISWSVMHSFQHQIPVYSCRKAVLFSFFSFFLLKRFLHFSYYCFLFHATSLNYINKKSHFQVIIFVYVHGCSSHDN